MTIAALSSRMTFLCAVLFVFAAAPAALSPVYAQAPSAPNPPASASAPVFDVAAIRVNKSDPSARSHIISSSSNGHFRAINVTLKSLLQWAYAIPDTRIAGGPAWLNSTKFDIDATADPAVDEQMSNLPSAEAKLRKQAMLQALLADRFQVKVHRESRELPIYALVLAKDGPKFKPSQINGTTINARRGAITVSGSDDTVALLADELARYFGRVVVNQTGLHDRYELDLKWTPDEPAPSRPGAPSGTAPAADSSLPSIFTAIQEQLGLKLESQKGPVSVLILDHIEMPSEN